MKLADELEEFGVEMEPDEFEDALREVWFALCPASTPDAIVCDPGWRKPFVREVRLKVGRKLPEEVILRRLLNLRKCSKAVSRN